MTLKEKYKEKSGRSAFVFDKKGRIIENFSYTDSYVSWLENQINSNKQIADDFAIGFAEWYLNLYESDDADTFCRNTMIKILEIYKKGKGL